MAGRRGPFCDMASAAAARSRQQAQQTHENLTRIAIVSEDRCRPKKCLQECKKTCPVNRMGRLCIDVTPESKIAYISETLCIGCGMCVRKCPFGAITVINLPTNLERDTTHRYGPNSFKLHRLPTPRPGQVLGLVGTNGIGKSTALRILSAKEKPNLGRFAAPPEWADVVQHFRGSELQAYFVRLLQDSLRAVVKPQFVEQIVRGVSGNVGALLEKYDERGVRAHLRGIREGRGAHGGGQALELGAEQPGLSQAADGRPPGIPRGARIPSYPGVVDEGGHDGVRGGPADVQRPTDLGQRELPGPIGAQHLHDRDDPLGGRRRRLTSAVGPVYVQRHISERYVE